MGLLGDESPAQRHGIWGVTRMDLALPDDIASIPEALRFWAARTPDAPALIGDAGQVLTHRALYDAVCRISSRLRGFGVQSGGRVVLLVPAGFDGEVVLLATMSAAVAVPLISTATMYELKRDFAANRRFAGGRL
jgi:acyl-CoA synthetase (AMP-forming)/AMP-acid ligase II